MELDQDRQSQNESEENQGKVNEKTIHPVHHHVLRLFAVCIYTREMTSNVYLVVLIFFFFNSRQLIACLLCFTLKYLQIVSSTFARAAAVVTRICICVSVLCELMCLRWSFTYARIVYGAVRLRGRKRVKKERSDRQIVSPPYSAVPISTIDRVLYSRVKIYRKSRIEPGVSLNDISSCRKRKKNRVVSVVPV